MDSGRQDELERMRAQIERLEMEKLLRGDEISALKAENQSYQDELRALSGKGQGLVEQALQENPVFIIGKEVRLRYLERHRQRMGRGISKPGYERIKGGDRAAHRGRPVADALLCLTGLITDREVYPDLYGVSPETLKRWKDVPEMIEITGFRASLQSEGRLMGDFQAPFERFLQRAKTYLSSVELKAAFRDDKALQQLQNELQNCYDSIVAANSRGR